jgi:hypothetical protein
MDYIISFRFQTELKIFGPGSGKKYLDQDQAKNIWTRIRQKIFGPGPGSDKKEVLGRGRTTQHFLITYILFNFFYYLGFELKKK